MPGLLIRWLLAVGLLLGAACAGAAPPDRLQVLVLSSFGKDYPSTAQLQAGLDEALGYTTGANEVFFEYLDAPMLPEADVTRELAGFLAAKYQSVHFDYLLAWAPSAAQFLSDHPDLFAGVPRLLIEVTTVQSVMNADGTTNVLDTTLDYERVLREIERVRSPSTLYVVYEETDENSRDRLKLFQAAKQRVWPDKPMELLRNLPLREARARLSTADPGGAVIYLLAFTDGEGTSLIPYRYAQLLAAQSPIPVFSFWGSLLGSGVVGGVQFSQSMIGRSLGLLLLQGGIPQDQTAIESHTTTYDYAAMRHWNLDISLIPETATVINLPENVFYRYRYQLVAIGTVLVLLSALSIGLTRALAARRVAMLLLQDERNNLADTIAFRTRELASMNTVLMAKNDELQKALHEVKILKGIIPICSYCKKIRNDAGFWDMVESYISKQPEAQFSHGVCPECLQSHLHEFKP